MTHWSINSSLIGEMKKIIWLFFRILRKGGELIELVYDWLIDCAVSKTCLTARELFEHLQSHNIHFIGKTFPCEICGKLLKNKYSLKVCVIVCLSVYLSVFCLSDHNSGIPRLICLKFWSGELVRTMEIFLVGFEWVNFVKES